MLFLKKNSHALEGDSLQWEDSSSLAGMRVFRATVSSWCLALSPAIDSPGGGVRALDFEACGRIASIQDADIVGRIEMRTDGAPPPSLACRWKRVPASIEGYATFDLNDENQHRLSLHLFCTEAAFDWLTRAFADGFSISGGSVVFEVTIDYPDEKDPAFWSVQWQIRTLQVMAWTVRTCARSSVSQLR